jgi:hydrogenase expression/formation protein HypE
MFFPGGDIGKLAVFGTVNDLAAAGAIPRWLSVGFILEEGLPLSDLERVVGSMKEAAAFARVDVVTGDTKVVDRGKGDGLYVTTSGIGTVPEGVDIRPARVCAGDAVLVTGDIGRHGVAVLSVRKGLAFESPIASDCAPLGDMMQALVGSGIDVHCARDATRGGLAAVLLEIAAAARVEMSVEEDSIPVDPSVSAACELLGLDVLHVANEGRMVVFVSEAEASRALDVLRTVSVSRNAALIGRVVSGGRAGTVSLRTRFGPERAIDLPAGEPLPRIC